jgi:hypothetical protein
MFLHRLFPATTALLGALAIAAPIASASGAPVAATTAAPSPAVCAQVESAGPMAVLGPYGPLGAYGPSGADAGQPNPATACGGATSFALPGFTVGSFVTANLSLAGQVPGTSG